MRCRRKIGEDTHINTIIPTVQEYLKENIPIKKPPKEDQSVLDKKFYVVDNER